MELRFEKCKLYDFFLLVKALGSSLPREVGFLNDKAGGWAIEF